ncbi:MAG: TetM/TetW/TetO/TetS family tetracycline resistance ribosomal protection protein [Oscillospiraceae bacterium]|nr:TetM/TetW/TetO/TetS family tetracycline resistance ribosomal protection protein [Oscillospiraceae bacterium]
MKKLVIGIMAHVDSGKTTLSEAMLYLSGSIKKLGRVDHRDAFLDNFSLERERGITIFSKQAILPLNGLSVTLLDTPGHVDFSTEMERTLQVLDYAVLVISGTDGVQSHTETLWRLLKRWNIPTLLFVNKMDLDGADKERVLEHLHARLDENIVVFGGAINEKDPVFLDEEALAMCDEGLMEAYLEEGELSKASAVDAIRQRKVFPCWFGSALRVRGVGDFLEDLEIVTRAPDYAAEFGAKVFKIARDNQGNRLTYLKVTGGTLKAKTLLHGAARNGEEWSEKTDQLRLYSGTKFTPVDTAEAGTICAVTGLTKTYPGQGLGMETDTASPLLEPVLTYQLILPRDCDPHVAHSKLKELEEEDPQLHLVWDPMLKQLSIQLMGQVQLEILREIIHQRFDIEVRFGTGAIVYKETIEAPVIGIGHFEPLRHYAEVHLLLEPGEPGSGLVFDTVCPLDVLDLNWQRLIFTHLEEKEHLGVLTGSPITDMKLTLLTGRAHIKHTEGGDFRQSTYRAIRQGLMQAKSILLEPWYQFRLEVPQECLGRAMSDVTLMEGSFEDPVLDGENAVLTGRAPVATMGDYQTQLAAYSKGRGRLNCSVDGYRPCHNTEEVVAARTYNPEADLDNTPDSVFCSHGAGTIVKWNEVPAHAHLDSSAFLQKEEPEEEEQPVTVIRRGGAAAAASDKELQAIFEKNYGSVKSHDFRPTQKGGKKTIESYSTDKLKLIQNLQPVKEFLLVDGYNILFAWDELKHLAEMDLNAARELLTEMMCNYQGYKGCGLILVFDAYKVPNNPGSVEKRGNIFVVYTKHAETADMYIEKVTYEIGKRYKVRVATSDGLEQLIILGNGALRVSARMFRQEVEAAEGALQNLLDRYRY